MRGPPTPTPRHITNGLRGRDSTSGCGGGAPAPRRSNRRRSKCTPKCTPPDTSLPFHCSKSRSILVPITHTRARNGFPHTAPRTSPQGSGAFRALHRCLCSAKCEPKRALYELHRNIEDFCSKPRTRQREAHSSRYVIVKEISDTDRVPNAFRYFAWDAYIIPPEGERSEG